MTELESELWDSLIDALWAFYDKHDGTEHRAEARDLCVKYRALISIGEMTPEAKGE